MEGKEKKSRRKNLKRVKKSCGAIIGKKSKNKEKHKKKERFKAKNRKNMEKVSSLVTPGALAQSCHSWSSFPVVSLLELLPSRVTPGAFAGEFLSSSGVLFSPSRITRGSLADEFTSPSGILLSDFACRGKKKFF